ncbi:MAG: hypothetical protein ACJ8FY_05675 [Gemmataceae bacterium]
MAISERTQAPQSEAGGEGQRNNPLTAPLVLGCYFHGGSPDGRLLPLGVMLPDSRGFLEALIDDGRPLITLTGLCLALSGAFALFQSATGQFLPHDTAFLQMSPQELCSINECRIVHFCSMIA